MLVIVPRLSGFCPGVKIAEKKLFQLKKARPEEPVFVYGYVINNRKYIEYLEENNIHTTLDMHAIPADAVIAIRTHGLAQDEEPRLREIHRVEDLTCTKVKRSQKEILRRSGQGFFIVIVGKKDHPETRGLASYAGNYRVVETTADIAALSENFPIQLEEAGTARVFIIAQTTAARGLFEETRSALSTRLAGIASIDSYDSICPVTEEKEREAVRLQAGADVSFVVGDKISANAKKLFQTLLEGSRETYFIEDLEDLIARKLPLAGYRIALVVSSASTPRFVENEIRAYLESLQA